MVETWWMVESKSKWNLLSDRGEEADLQTLTYFEVDSLSPPVQVQTQPTRPDQTSHLFFFFCCHNMFPFCSQIIFPLSFTYYYYVFVAWSDSDVKLMPFLLLFLPFSLLYLQEWMGKRLVVVWFGQWQWYDMIIALCGINRLFPANSQQGQW